MSELAPHHPMQVEPGVLLTDLRTVEDCDAAFDRLNVAIATIEKQLAGFVPASVDQSGDWRARARSALRFKKLMLPRLQEHRAWLKRQSRMAGEEHAAEARRAVTQDKRRALIRVGWEIEPDAMRRIEAVARERHPDLFTEEPV